MKMLSIEEADMIMEEVYDFCDRLEELTKERQWFMAATCMLVEEYCRRHNEDVVEYHKYCMKSAERIVKDLGKY